MQHSLQLIINLKVITSTIRKKDAHKLENVSGESKSAHRHRGINSIYNPTYHELEFVEQSHIVRPPRSMLNLFKSNV